MESWRPIECYSQYQVSDQGRVRRRLEVGYRPLKRLTTSNGYLQVCLHRNGDARRFLIHALVAAAFTGPRPSATHQINHRNGDKTDNRLINLEYVTGVENRRHASVAGLCARGERNGSASLSDVVVARIKSRLRGGLPQVALAARYGVTKSVINRIAKGQCWAWLEASGGDIENFLIRGRRTAQSRWCTAGCEDSLPAATAAAAAMMCHWFELRVERDGRVIVNLAALAHESRAA